MTYKGTTDHLDAGDLEVLNISPSWHDNGVGSQSVCIAPLDNRDASLIVSKLYRSGEHHFAHITFIEPEVDMLIEALQECKKRWDEGKVIGENK